MESKKCTKCAEIKSLREYSKDAQKKSGYRPQCKSCCSKQKKEDLENNPEKYKDRSRRYYLQNVEIIKSKVKKYAPGYLRAKRLKDPVHRKKSSISTSLRKVLNREQLYTSNSSLYEVIGISAENLINYLYSTFEANYGIPRGWIYLKDVEIDHITPISTAKTIEDVKRLNHHTNLQLLFKEDNRIKGANLLDLSNQLV